MKKNRHQSAGDKGFFCKLDRFASECFVKKWGGVEGIALYPGNLHAYLWLHEKTARFQNKKIRPLRRMINSIKQRYKKIRSCMHAQLDPKPERFRTSSFCFDFPKREICFRIWEVPLCSRSSGEHTDHWHPAWRQRTIQFYGHQHQIQFRNTSRFRPYSQICWIIIAFSSIWSSTTRLRVDDAPDTCVDIHCQSWTDFSVESTAVHADTKARKNQDDQQLILFMTISLLASANIFDRDSVEITHIKNREVVMNNIGLC